METFQWNQVLISMILSRTLENLKDIGPESVMLMVSSVTLTITTI